MKIVKEGKLSFLLHCAQCFTYPSFFSFLFSSPTILLFSLLNFLFSFVITSSYSTFSFIYMFFPPPPPPQHFYCFPPPPTPHFFFPPPPPPPHFYCFPPPPPPTPPHLCCFHSSYCFSTTKVIWVSLFWLEFGLLGLILPEVGLFGLSGRKTIGGVKTIEMWWWWWWCRETI